MKGPAKLGRVHLGLFRVIPLCPDPAECLRCLGNNISIDLFKTPGLKTYKMTLVCLGATTSVTSRYVGTFFAVLIFISASIVLIWNANTNSTSSKRAGGLWIIMTVGQCGPLLGTNVFPSSQASLYREESWICCTFALLSGVTALVLSLCLWQENKKMDRLYELDPVERLENYAYGVPRFRYII